MLKAFLSHSSKNKGYVENVAKNLTTNYCVYDSFSFEEATKTAEEIVKSIEKSSIFVFFISKHSLQSEWVDKELEKVYELLKNGEKKKILPIIIDQNIKHNDTQIPQWLKDNYNIQPIFRYKKAVQRIKQELLKLSWDIDSNKKIKDTLFVGRNNLIDKLEEKYRENFNPPIAVIASGINGIGRRSLIREYMQKVGIADKSKYISIITLEKNESIEDFILKLDDLGFNINSVSYTEISTIGLDEKIRILKDILVEIHNENEIILIEDNGCLVLPDRNLNEWFISLLREAKKENLFSQMTLAIVSQYKLNKHILTQINTIYAIDVKELENKEIDWMFKDLLRINKIELDIDEYRLIRNLMYGHPEQILYATKLLELEGYQAIYKNTNILVDFNLQKTSYLLSKYKDNDIAKSLLAMLSKFDFIDYELLNKLIGDDEEKINLIQQFISESICNELGANKETIKLNKAIRDTIRRGDWKVDSSLHEKIKEHTINFLKTYESEEKSLSDYFYSMQEILVNNYNSIDISKIIPSHILKTISTLYDVKKKWKSVIPLAKDALYENFNNLDQQIENQIRQYLCLSYIRTKNNSEFLKEVQKLEGNTYDFLMGFYYRTNGRYSEAINRFQKVLALSSNQVRAKRELVQVFLAIYDYESALELSKEIYYHNKQNAYAFQAYSTCLLKTYYNNQRNKKDELTKIFSEFEKLKNNSSTAQEFYDIEYAKFEAQQNHKKAIDLIDDAIKIYDNSIYPLIAKFDIAEKLNDIQQMENVLKQLKEIKEKLPNKNIIDINEAVLLSKSGKKDLAKLKINSLRHYPEKSRQLLLNKLNIK